MTPTLIGRVQTRIFLMLFIALPWTLLITPLLPGTGDASLSSVYRMSLRAWFLVLVIGCVVWEPIYHGLQQFRWEKDWPTMFALLVGVAEGIVVWLLLDVRWYTFVILFASTWLLVWLTAIGPIKILMIRWRFRGGRII